MTYRSRIEQLDRYTIPEPMSGCWLWTACVDGSGYGMVQIATRKCRRAHIVSYEQRVGPIPPGKILRHRCDVPCCVNPDHLEIGTHGDNARDKVQRGRQKRGVQTKHARLSDDDILSIRASADTQAEIALAYGISASHVSRIRSRQKWAHIE